MPRTITTTKTVYLFSELSDSARDRARQWLHESSNDLYWSESVLDYFTTLAGHCGWTISTRNHSGHPDKPSIYFSGFSSQGDGACFEGRWSAEAVSVRALRQYAPKDIALHRIAREFRRLAHLERHATATSTHSGHYCHERSVSIDAEPNRPDHPARDAAWSQWERDLYEVTADLAQWLYRALEAEHDYQFFGEGCDDTMAANGYTFLEDGRRYG